MWNQLNLKTTNLHRARFKPTDGQEHAETDETVQLFLHLSHLILLETVEVLVFVHQLPGEILHEFVLRRGGRERCNKVI